MNALDGYDGLVVICDGGIVLRQNLETIDALARRGGAVVAIHYTLDVPKGEPGDKLRDWTGGAYEQHWSVNPSFKAKFTEFPDHPVARGLEPFEIDDEWYYHMRFRPEMQGVTPILTCVPPDSTRERPDGAHSGNPTVRSRKGMGEHVAWAAERDGGGRGFGFTGGHHHWNWAHPQFRKAVLNGIVWSVGLDVPEGGVETATPTLDDLTANQDEEPWSEDRMKRVRDAMAEWSSSEAAK